MSANISAKSPFAEQMLAQLRDIQREAKGPASAATEGHKSGPSFSDYLKQGVQEVNNTQVTSDRMSMELSTGKTGNIHETMLAATHAELSFNLMVQLRNKALESYSEIMRMPV